MSDYRYAYLLIFLAIVTYGISQRFNTVQANQEIIINLLKDNK